MTFGGTALVSGALLRGNVYPANGLCLPSDALGSLSGLPGGLTAKDIALAHEIMALGAP